ncbi:MAG: GHKL domain-containing protein [Cellvibrio sp.]|nr:GHKL domain-containing protein [Cellvibrio sp.]
MVWRSDSLESSLKTFFALVAVSQLVCLALLWKPLAAWQYGLLVFVLICVDVYVFRGFYQKTMSIFNRIGIQLDSLQQQDYSLSAKPVFNDGCVGELHQQLDSLTHRLQKEKRYRDQQPFLLYRLIDQLNTPILVFDNRLQLDYANAAFSNLFHQPWQTLRHASPGLLGLESAPEWRFVESEKALQWQIRQSSFMDQGHHYQLLVFINIQSVLRESQLQAWQQIIRVLGHEIRNSLTPVSALTQSLQSRATAERDQQALRLISERCQHLQDFVSRYAELHKPLQIKPEWIKADSVFQSLKSLFPDAELQAKGLHLDIWVDSMLLQQVLINLIKNAIEAGSPKSSIEIIFSTQSQQQEIRVIDAGQGIANIDNLFVPFYSTKSQGQGIGLSLSRHIIEQMGGQLKLINNSHTAGATASIVLHRHQ